MSIGGINHIVLKVRSLEESDRFYREVVGLRLVGKRSGMWFYTSGAHHHDLALLQLGAEAPSAVNFQTGMFHFCFDVSDETELARLYARCREAGVRMMGAVDHNVTRSFYVRDPDGNMVEFAVEIPRDRWHTPEDPFGGDRLYRIPEPERV